MYSVEDKENVWITSMIQQHMSVNAFGISNYY